MVVYVSKKHNEITVRRLACPGPDALSDQSTGKCGHLTQRLQLCAVEHFYHENRSGEGWAGGIFTPSTLNTSYHKAFYSVHYLLDQNHFFKAKNQLIKYPFLSFLSLGSNLDRLKSKMR